MCGQLSLLVICLLTNNYKYEEIVKFLQKTDIPGNILNNSSNDKNNKNYSTKVQNDIDYINATDDTLTGDLNVNENKIILKDSKQRYNIFKEMILMEQCLETHMELHLQIFRIMHYFRLQQIFL